MSDISQFAVSDGIAVLMIDNPPVNALSQAVRAALLEAVGRTAADGEVRALVIACARRTFFAGADITEFGRPTATPALTDVVDAIEACDKPVCAAIHGTTLGGGLEVALACHYRVATRDAKLGLPEVKLGLIPGARGTQRLPRLVGINKALEMIALGEPIAAPEALALGLVDEIAEGDLLTSARALAGRVSGESPRRTRDRAVPHHDGSAVDAFMTRNARKFRGLEAPKAAVALVRAAAELSFDEGAARERETFLQLRDGPQSEALRHVFFAERQAAKVPGLEDARERAVASVGVVGGGTMGTGISIALLSAGLRVTMVERDPAALERAVTSIAKTLDGNAAAGRISAEAAARAKSALTPALATARLAEVDLVIEAAFETMEVKRTIFTELDKVARPDAILATNTSYLDIDAIAQVTSRPSNFLGLHFFSPANIMKLLEIVRGRETAPDVLATAIALGRRIGKVPVVSGNAPGFIGNRMLAVRRQEAEEMVLQGASPSQVDRVLEEFGFPMGPFRMADLAGLDLGWSAERSTGSTIRERLCEAGRRGQKTAAGFYDYDDNRKSAPSPAAEDIIAGFARDKGVERRRFEDQEILDRLLWPMVDEGARLLDEGIALRASDIDVVWINGYGWPAWTGGPMFHARRAGAAAVFGALERIGREPSAGLTKLLSNDAGVRAGAGAVPPEPPP